MKPSSPEELSVACGAKLLRGKAAAGLISHILFDSRRVFHPSESLFVAIKTARNDGHRYIESLILKGVKHFLVQHVPEFPGAENCTFLVVPNSLKALQLLAKHVRSQFQGHVVGITGSNGKTIVKEWLYAILHQHQTVYRSPKSYNSQLGVALSLCHLEPEASLALIEAGISQPGEMLMLHDMIVPNSGIFTNIGNAHGENFSSKTEKLHEKLSLFENCDLIVYCRDHEEVHKAITQRFADRSFSWGRHKEAQLHLTPSATPGAFTYWQDGISGEINIPFADAASIENVLHCFAWISASRMMPLNEASIAIQQLQPPEMRLELLQARNGCTLINDAWIADLDSLKMALNTMMAQTHHSKRCVILSDIPSAGQKPEKVYTIVKQLLHEAGVNRLFGIGEEVEQHLHSFEGDVRFFPNTEAFLAALPTMLFQQECILLKGARRFGFERIALQFARQTHETVLKINLSNILHNVQHYRSRIAPETALMAMVKAFSYGSGHTEVAALLQNHGIDYLAVAFVDEGLELRQAGVRLPIMVMSPEKSGIPQMLDAGLEPEIYSFSMLAEFSKVLHQRNGYDEMPLRIHIKLNTGMNRLGFDAHEWDELATFLSQKPELEVATIFSHLAASDDPQHDAFTKSQINQFRDAVALFRTRLKKPFWAHLANSAAISRHPDARFDMVRLGIGMYGVGTADEEAFLQPVAQLETRITQIRYLREGDTVGYSRKGKIERPSRIATLPLGYADGFPRKLGNGNFSVMVHGRLAPTIGSICMDMCMIDVTGIPEAIEGDKVIVFDNARSIKAMADALETIPYEVMTGISQRVKRVYFQD